MRLQIIGLYWAFAIIVLAPEISRNYSKERLFNEMGFSAFLILLAFILNSTLSTLFGYFPKATYGFTSGISFGNIDIPEYNIFPLAVFLTLRKGMLDKKPLFIAIGVISLFFILLTLRRTVMVLSVFAVIIVMVELLNFKQIKQFALYGILLTIVVLVVVNTTGFSDQLIERIEKRNIQDKDLTEEGRFLELELLYKDLFVYYEYDPWFGYGPLSSWGNYGRKVFGNRPLHTDTASFIHGFGFFGLFLYLAIVFFVFFEAWKRCYSKGDRLLFLFVGFYFAFYFLVGIPKLPLSPVMLFMTLGILFGKKEGYIKTSNTFLKIPISN